MSVEIPGATTNDKGQARFECLWRNKFLTTDARTIDEMIAGLAGAIGILQEMRDAGVSSMAAPKATTRRWSPTMPKSLNNSISTRPKMRKKSSTKRSRRDGIDRHNGCGCAGPVLPALAQPSINMEV